jgi:hypothetical protein
MTESWKTYLAPLGRLLMSSLFKQYISVCIRHVPEFST